MCRYASILICVFFIVCVNGRRMLPMGHDIYEYQSGLQPSNTFRRTTRNVDTEYFEQKLDQFNESNKARWLQRYEVNYAHYDHGGPIFLRIDGNSISRANFGHWYLNGQKFHALMFQLEHRFYGRSKPTDDTSIENLRYLTISQALADLEEFIKGMKKEYNIPKAKVILFGCSYGGNLAVWHRQLYPNSTVGAVASSAPVLAKEKYFQFKETVGEAIKAISVDCYDDIEIAIKGIERMIDANECARLTSLFHICMPKRFNCSNPDEASLFVASLIQPWEVAAQSNKLGNRSLLADYCRTLTDDRDYETAVDRYSYLFTVHLKKCAYYDYEKFKENYKNQSWNSDGVKTGDQQWLWQSCTELISFETTDSTKQPFGRKLDLKFMKKLFCQEDPLGISSSEITLAVAKTNQRYGGKSPNVTNVFFLNGSLDPWYRMGVLNSTLTSPAKLIEGTSHCYDINADDINDTPALIQARFEVADTLSFWLQNPKTDVINDTTTTELPSDTSTIPEITTNSVDILKNITSESTISYVQNSTIYEEESQISVDHNHTFVVTQQNSSLSDKISTQMYNYALIGLGLYIFSNVT